jgi:hypothetical protein
MLFFEPGVALPERFLEALVAMFFEPSVALPDRFLESEFRVLVGPLLKREMRLLFCGAEMFFEVVGGATRLFFLFIALVMFEAKLLISIFIV